MPSEEAGLGPPQFQKHLNTQVNSINSFSLPEFGLEANFSNALSLFYIQYVPCLSQHNKLWERGGGSRGGGRL